MADTYNNYECPCCHKLVEDDYPIIGEEITCECGANLFWVRSEEDGELELEQS